MQDHVKTTNRRYYERTIGRIDDLLNTPQEICFVLVQHAFTPSVEFYRSIENRIAAVILKGSSAQQNPTVVFELKKHFGTRIKETVKRSDLADTAFTVNFLKESTAGRPFVILEYGGYFAPSIAAISYDPILGPNLKGVVEGTDNGIKGSADGKTIGYSAVVEGAKCPVISKSRSTIKQIMDIDIGPAIVSATDDIVCKTLGTRLKYWRGIPAVVGSGSIGSGILAELKSIGHTPLVYDSDLAVMAELAHRHHRVVDQTTALANSDLLFLSTGSCFLSQQPELLALIRNNALLVLCTSGDVEAGIPQLIAKRKLRLIEHQSNHHIAVYRTSYGKNIRLILGADKIGQAPNMSVSDGSASPANVMSDMEFYALGCHLASDHKLAAGFIHQSPIHLQKLILKEWLLEFYPSTCSSSKSAKPSNDFSLEFEDTAKTERLQTQSVSATHIV